jgi:hypothetical protein
MIVSLRFKISAVNYSFIESLWRTHPKAGRAIHPEEKQAACRAA